MSAIKEKENDPVHSVVHCRQQFNWDCGVSCVLMLLQDDQRELFLKEIHKICAEEDFGHSTWTIDLCYLMKRFGIKHHMYTTMLGVNEDYMKHGYYNNILDLDRDRVQRRFQQAPAAQIVVSQGSIGTAALVQHLRAHGPAVVLVDAGLLVCDICKHNKLKAEFRRFFGGGFKGHYVVVVGFSSRACKFLYRDPALSPRLCALSYSQMDRCRTAVGTDHDCILVYTQKGTS